MLTQKNLIIAAGISGFISVALGAFGAHFLKSRLSPEMLDIFKTGVFYHLIHSVVILAIAFYGKPEFYKSAALFIGGIILFSFSLYLYSVTSIKIFALITPAGGVLQLSGWISIIIIQLKKPND